MAWNLTEQQWVDLSVDAILVMGFGFQHSVIATLRLKKLIQRAFGLDALSWRGVQSLLNVAYILMACALWREVPIVVWDVQGLGFWLLGGVLVASWIWYFQIHIFEYDCGLAFGSSAIISRLHGMKPPPMEMWKVGTRRWLRFPVHTAFFPMFFAFPHMTLSTLVLAVTANLANIIGTVLYDRRLIHLAKEPYQRYRTVTGLVFPPLRRAPAGARDMQLPSPKHWSSVADNVPGLLLGLGAGVLFSRMLGALQLSTNALLLAWLLAFLVALVGGGLLAFIQAMRPSVMSLSYPRLQTTLATNAALMSAVSLITWGGLAFLQHGRLPVLFVYLPLWMTMLWIGHFMSFILLCGLRPSLTQDRQPSSQASLAPVERTVSPGMPQDARA
jgi:hypothetical protein